MTTVINLYGGPGTGKSTCSAALFALMKRAGYSVELVREYAKDLAWKREQFTEFHEIKILTHQFERESLLYNKVDYIITDSPLQLPIIYEMFYQSTNHIGHFAEKLQRIKEKKNVKNLNFFLKRYKGYVQEGRNESFEQAKQIDDLIKKVIPRLLHIEEEFHELEIIRILQMQKDKKLQIKETPKQKCKLCGQSMLDPTAPTCAICIDFMR